jgi:hypothetical protein
VSLEISKLKERGQLDRIAFFGPMASGKTFCANYLTSAGYFQKVALADKLKAVVYDLYGVQGKDGNGRKILQEFSDDCKKWDSDVFIKHFLYKVKQIEDGSKHPPRIVCDDLRYIREAEVLGAAGFTLIKVSCQETLRASRIATLYPKQAAGAVLHRSEREFGAIAATLVNPTEIVSEDYGALVQIDKEILYG